jgi:hypothetical protein
LEPADFPRVYGPSEEEEQELDRDLAEIAEGRAREKQEVSLREDRLLALAEEAQRRDAARVKRERLILLVTILTLVVAIATLIVTIAVA